MTAAPPPSPSLDDQALGSFVLASAALSGLVIEPEWEAAVLANLKATALAARQVLEFPLPDEIEPASVFAA